VTLVEKHATYPSREAFLVGAPALARDKERPGFARKWATHQQLLLWPLGATASPTT